MIKELKEHLDALRRWIERQGDIPTPQPGLSAEEQKQFLGVNKAIMQFTRSGVSVPETLRDLKLQLSNKEGSGALNHEVEERIAEVEAVIEQLLRGDVGTNTTCRGRNWGVCALMRFFQVILEQT